MSNLPISTQSVLDASGVVDSSKIMSVVMVYTDQGSKGTGWLCSNQHVVTNEHVIRGAHLNSITVRFSDGTEQRISAGIFETDIDVAVLTLSAITQHEPLKINTNTLELGSKVYAWGHPLGYSGPPPILSVGYVAGFNTMLAPSRGRQITRMVLNAALNPGNSGGPIMVWGSDEVCGMAVTKHAPISSYLQSAISALGNNQSGIVFSGTNQQGQPITLSESQLVAQVLEHFQSMTQVVIGESVTPRDIINYLNANSIPWTEA